MDFTYEVTESKGIILVKLSGRLLGKEQTEDLSNQLAEQIANGNNQFVADLTNLAHMNSTGLNILITFLTKARNAGGEFIIINVPESINKLLIITKLNRVFHIEAGLDEAVAALAAGTSES